MPYRHRDGTTHISWNFMGAFASMQAPRAPKHTSPRGGPKVTNVILGPPEDMLGGGDSTVYI